MAKYKGSRSTGGARVKKAKASGQFAPEALRGPGTFGQRIAKAKATLPKPQAKKLGKAARSFRKSLKK